MIDSQSRIDYYNFGDVLVFETIYRTNLYRKPLVVMAVVNNHYMTCIFAYALLLDKSVETYNWLLETFLEAMW